MAVTPARTRVKKNDPAAIDFGWLRKASSIDRVISGKSISSPERNIGSARPISAKKSAGFQKVSIKKIFL
ncbi:MAG: hypothetical protein ABII93_02190 [Chrysiogenia bacterium]